MIKYIGDLFLGLWNGILKIFTHVYWFFQGIFYLFSKAFEIGIYIFEILYMLLQVFFAFVSGLISTVWAIANYNPANVVSIYNPYAQGTQLAITVWNNAGFTVLAGVLSWALYIITAVAVLKLLKGAH